MNLIFLLYLECLAFEPYHGSVQKAYEDIMRYLVDNEINNTSVNVIKNGELVKIKWKNIVVIKFFCSVISFSKTGDVKIVYQILPSAAMLSK